SKIFERYKAALSKVDGLAFHQVPDYACNNHWMNLVQIDFSIYGGSKEKLIQNLADNGIQARPVWSLNHLQKPYSNQQSYRIENAVSLAENSLCLPSSSNLSNDDIDRVINLLNE
ncbi:MAG: DegT/DnrJ/EryC1/StrS family aminotransferase, partial [Anaerolineales bacterium]|nr:DegT/DnrJ/EryC1/StrS family aminotransferase [Anaerolineales bacterium]